MPPVDIALAGRVSTTRKFGCLHSDRSKTIRRSLGCMHQSTIIHLQHVEPMKCPKCNVSLVMTDRAGIEIDYCPDCRGIWLDRGELDKIIERSSQPYTKPSDFDDRKTDFGNYRREEHRDDPSYGYKKKKKESFLGDLFDF